MRNLTIRLLFPAMSIRSMHLYWNDNVSIQDLQMTTASGGNYGAGITSH